jgi:hypothetical protein
MKPVIAYKQAFESTEPTLKLKNLSQESCQDGCLGQRYWQRCGSSLTLLFKFSKDNERNSPTSE